MAYKYTQPTLTGGVDEILVEVSNTVNTLLPGFLLFIWGFVFFSGMATQKARSGYADAPLWATMSSLSTLLITLLLTIKIGMVNLPTLGVVVSITIICALWLFLSRGRGEF